jgi:hypothetical protein
VSRSAARQAVLRRGALALVAFNLAGCGFSAVLDKRESAARIAGAAEATAAAGVSTGSEATSLTVVKVRTPIPGVNPGFTTPAVTLPLILDVAHGRSALTANVKGEAGPIKAYDESTYLQLMSGGTRARPWASFDFARIYDKRASHTGEGFGNDLMNPTHALWLLPGVLTGSIRDLGRQDVAGVSTHHFSANFDATKAVKHAPRARREGLLAALALMSVDPESIPGEVWVDDKDVARQTTVHLRQRFTSKDVIAVNVTVLLDKVGAQTLVPLPPSDSTTRTDDLGSIVGGMRDIASKLGAGGPRP